jgi:hypothetical protein
MSENEQTNNTAVSERDSANDRSDERGDRPSRGESGELSGGRRDRSRELLREELSRNLDDATRRTGGKRDFEPADRPARAAREAIAEAKDRGQEAAAVGAGAAVDTSVAPKSMRADERAYYDKLPPEIKHWMGNFVHRREEEMKAGVLQDRQKYAAEDAAWLPHEGALRAHGVSRAQAISNMLGWHNYLHRDPVNGFTDLVKTLPPDKQQVLLQHAQRTQQQGGAQAQQTNAQQGYDPRQLLQYVDQRIGSLAEQQQLERCNAVLAEFAKGRPHFEKVRGAMAAFLQPDANGRSIIPLTFDGQVDLASAYDMACRADPTIGEQIISERIAAKTKAQREQAERARRAGASLGGAAPGGNNSVGAPKKRSGSVSVRESLRQSLDELAGR